jgi:hypothetical protein
MQLIVNEKNNFLIMNLEEIDKYFIFMMSTPVYVLTMKKLFMSKKVIFLVPLEQIEV